MLSYFTHWERRYVLIINFFLFYIHVFLINTHNIILNFIGQTSEIDTILKAGIKGSPWCAMLCWEMIVDGKLQYCCCRDKHWCNETPEHCQERCNKRAKCHGC